MLMRYITTLKREMKPNSEQCNNRIFTTIISVVLGIAFALESGSFAFADTSTRHNLSDCYYDDTREAYVYTTTNGFEIVTNIVNGMYTTGTVNISAAGLANCKLYRDGKEVSDSLANITEPGHYVLDYSSSQKYEALKFTILNDVTGLIDEYVLPTGFAITDVIYNGNRIRFANDRVDFQEEGTYEVSYRCKLVNKQYRLDLTIDHTPPVLEISNIVDGVAEGPVVVSEVEKDAKLYIEKDGKEVSLYTGRELRDSGNYLVMLTDKAGNVTSQNFKILFYLNLDSKVFIVLLAIFFVVVIIVLIVKRKTLRIR